MARRKQECKAAQIAVAVGIATVITWWPPAVLVDPWSSSQEEKACGSTTGCISKSRLLLQSYGQEPRVRRSAKILDEDLPDIETLLDLKTDVIYEQLEELSKREEKREEHVRKVGHDPVMARETVDRLLVPGLKPTGGVYVDCTFGRGGHSREILSRLGSNAQLFAFDVDPTAITVAQQLAGEDKRFQIFHRPFGEIAEALPGVQLDGVLMDLGVSSPQLDDDSRGFTTRGGPVDMRMNQAQGVSAAEWLTNVSVEELAWVIHAYGERDDPILAERIAEAILDSQQKHGPYKSARDLADVVRMVKTTDDWRHHPARFTFQAIRIFLNHEMTQAALALHGAFNCLKPGGRCVVLTFKQQESKVVRDFLRDHEDAPRWAAGSLTQTRLKELYPLLGTDLDFAVRQVGAPIRPGSRKIEANSRQRSASFITLEKVPRQYPKSLPSDAKVVREFDSRFRKPDPPTFRGAIGKSI